jgi:hypothetical protein
MVNDSKIRHIAQSTNHHHQQVDNDVNADVELEREHASRAVDNASATQTPPTPAGGYPFAPPFMQPPHHKRMQTRAKPQAQPVATTPPAEVRTVETTITTHVVRIATRHSL